VVQASSVVETVGIERRGEPVDIAVAFRSNQSMDLCREVRLARLDADQGVLREVPCQVYNELRRGTERRCRLVFLADVPAHGEATYLAFYGNSYAELPRHVTDLRTSGQGYGLDIENNHFVARLSRQMGQLDRLPL
jgi:hypothetical protein